MEKKRLCLVIPSLQAGGMERVMAELAGYFAASNDIEVHLVLYGISREIFYPLHKDVIVHRPGFKFNNRLRLLSTLRTLSYLRRTIKKIKPLSALSFGEYWNNFFLLSVIGLGIRTYVSDRSQPDKSLGRFHDQLRKWLYPKATGLILQTEKAKEIYLRNARHNNIAVIGNPIRKISFSPTTGVKEKIVLTVGRLITSKHQDMLIEMFAHVSNEEWKLMIAGYDHLKQQNMKRLRLLARDLGIEERVIFTGKHNNIDELYNRSSVFAFTSSSEGFPNVIGEAMASGLPVIAFDCIAGPSDMITDGKDGFLISLFNRQQFESKLELLMSDSDLRKMMGDNGRESIKRFESGKICETFHRFILS